MPTSDSWRVRKPLEQVQIDPAKPRFILPELYILSTKAARSVFCALLQSHEASAPGGSYACFDFLDSFPF